MVCLCQTAWSALMGAAGGGRRHLPLRALFPRRQSFLPVKRSVKLANAKTAGRLFFVELDSSLGEQYHSCSIQRGVSPARGNDALGAAFRQGEGQMNQRDPCRACLRAWVETGWRCGQRDMRVSPLQTPPLKNHFRRSVAYPHGSRLPVSRGFAAIAPYFFRMGRFDGG